MAALCVGQDPFEDGGMGGDLDTSAAAAAVAPNQTKPRSAEGGLANERSAVVRTLRSTPPKNHDELARAVMLMTRIRRWDEVGHWLDEIAKRGVNEASAVQMTQNVGTQPFVQLLSPDVPISESQRATARKIIEQASLANTNMQRVSGHVKQLFSKDKSERILAFKAIKSAGHVGIAALINYQLSEQATAPNSTMCEAFSLLGPQAHAAWQAAMLTPHADARGRLALLAVRLGEPSMLAALCAAANDASVPETVRDHLSAIAKEHGKQIPTAISVNRHALTHMHNALRDYQQIRWNDEADSYTVWVLANDGRSVAEVPGKVSDLHWMRAVQNANSALLSSESADIDSATAVAVLVENAARTSPDTTSIDSISQRLPRALVDGYEFGSLIWDAAIKADLPYAQWVAIRNLSRWGVVETMPNAVRDRLAAGCESGHAAVRFAAAQALVGAMVATNEDGTTKLVDLHFDGRNRLEKVLAEMRLLEDKPLILVVGGNPDLRTHVSTLLETFSYRVSEAASAAQAMGELRRGQPVEGVFIVDRVLEMDLGQLIQRMRSAPSASDCPIALLASSLSMGEHSIAGSDSKVVLGSVPPEESGFVDILRRMRVVSQSPVIDSTHRIQWRELANDYWANQQGQFVSASPKSSFTASVESPVGQARLIEIVLDKSKPLPQREQASQIFVQSVKQFGLLISSETANAQYHEYNERGPDEIELRIVLGRVLDAIEAAKGIRTWAEVAP
jgi:CheY-like chemotaxis protein